VKGRLEVFLIGITEGEIMPLYPNPYQPKEALGAGLQNIAAGIFNAGKIELAGQYARRQTEEQAAERLAHAQEREARMKLLNSQATEQELRNSGLTPEALSEYAADSVNMPADLYNRIMATPPGHFDLDQGPAPGLQFSDADIGKARRGRSLASYFLQNQNPNPEQFAKAAGVYQTNDFKDQAMRGLISADAFGDVQAAAEGKPRYGMSNGVQYSNQLAGSTSMTPLGDAMVGAQKSIVGKNNAQARQADAAASLNKVRTDAGGFAPRSNGGGAGSVPKRVSLTKAEAAAMENQLADLVGTEFKKIDPQSRAAFISRASALAVDPESEFHCNPAGAMEQAVAELAPNGFEDSADMFSSAKFVPKGGGVSQRQPAPKQAGSGGLPPQARAALREGLVTRFGNGQAWALQNGVPVRMQ
jgi:hypothetical protein